jgi:hypothetical protein
MARVRANPQQFPDAATDFAKLSGKTPEEVQAIIDNPGSSGFWGTIGGSAIDVGQGLMEAGAIAAENLIPAETLGEGANMVRDFSQRLDPKFESEKSFTEGALETVGQAIPAVAVTIGTGGWAGIALGAGMSTLTMADDENFTNAMNEIAPGITPDILVVNPDDDEFTKTSKALVTNVVIDGMMLGASSVVGKALKALKSGAPVEEIAKIAKEAEGVAVDKAFPLVQAQEISKAAARKHIGQQLDLFEKTGSVAVAQQVDPQVRKVFMDNVFASFKKLGERTSEVAGGLEKFSAERTVDLSVYADRVLNAFASSDKQQLVSLLKKGVKANDAVEAAYINPFQNAVIKSTLDLVDARFDDAVKLIRENPDSTTRAAFKATLQDAAEYKVEIGELYRLYGSSPSYQMLDRKGVLPSGGFEEVIKAEKALKESVKDFGFDLFSDKVEFMHSQVKTWDDLGIDVSKVIPELEDMFNKFDVERQGILANMGKNATMKLSPEQRATMTASYVRMVKDIQSAALLGQFSTTGLEVISNTLNNMLLPFIEHGLGKRNLARAGAEYAGYASAFKTAKGIAWKTFVKGKGVLDDADLMEGAHSGILDYANLSDKPLRHLMLRLFKFATDVSLASSEFWKSTRAYGLAYADGLELALKSGQGRVAAKQSAKAFAAKQFDETGALVNAFYRNDVSKTSWQAAFDTRYWTGSLAQQVDNFRHRDDVTGLLARSAIPFFRTLVNIGSDASQYLVPPGVPKMLRMMSEQNRFQWLKRVPKVLKTLDDFTGANGVRAQTRAIGRSRLGLSFTASALSAVAMSDKVEFTGASGLKRWDARKRSFEEYPPNSIIIGDVSVDLSRLLPFSSPLMLAGMMRDLEIENQLNMQGGNYAPESGATEALARYGQALAFTSMTLFQDSAAAQGVFDIATAFDEALSEGNAGPLLRYAQKYASQFTPGPLKMAAKNTNFDQYEGYDFFSAYAAASGFPVGYKRLDFIGEPIVHGFGRGFDPLNMKRLHNDSPIHKEFIFLNQTGGLALVPPRPDAVFDKSFWKSMGIDVGGAFSSGNMPSLTDLETIDGKNGWDAYRDLLYRGQVPKDTLVSTSSQGDKIDIGKVLIKKGENFKSAMDRLISDGNYDNLTPDARAKVWNAVFAYFKKQTKDQLADTLVVTPSVFQDGRYGSPITAPNPLAVTEDAAKDLGASIQQTKGSPLDAAFSIKR